MSSVTGQWQACEAGQIQRIAKRLQNQRVWRSVRRDFAVGFVVLAFVLTGYIGADVWANQPADLGGAMCYQISRLHLSIVADKLPPEMRASVERHLAMCPHCREGVELARVEFKERGWQKMLRENSGQPEHNDAAHHDGAHSAVFSVAP